MYSCSRHIYSHKINENNKFNEFIAFPVRNQRTKFLSCPVKVVQKQLVRIMFSMCIALTRMDQFDRTGHKFGALFSYGLFSCTAERQRNVRFIQHILFFASQQFISKIDLYIFYKLIHINIRTNCTDR